MAVSRTKAQPESALIARVAAVLAEAGVGRASRVCVALSGGVDSTVVLHVLAGLRSAAGFSLCAAHVHHGISPHAEQWLEHCTQACARLNVPLSAMRVSVSRDHPDGLEAAAREARHAALASVQADWLVFGHHQDDQAETVLFRLLRGAGVRGAGAMAPVASHRLRPLLGTRRGEILAYARSAGLAWVEDESNADVRHVRNRLRHQVLPSLETVFPAAGAMLARSADNFREADVLLADLAELDAVACGGGSGRWRVEAVQALSDSRLRNLIRWRIHALGLDAPPRAHLIEAVRQLRASATASLYLPLGGAVCCMHQGSLWVECSLGAVPSAMNWRPDTEGEVGWADGRVVCRVARGEGLSLTLLETAKSAVLGTRGEGLRMRIAPGRPRRSFKNLCQEAGTPAWLREYLPVLYVDGAPVWIGGIGMSSEAVCAPGERGVQLEWLRNGYGA